MEMDHIHFLLQSLCKIRLAFYWNMATVCFTARCILPPLWHKKLHCCLWNIRHPVATNAHAVVYFDSIQNAPSCFHKYGTKLQTPDGFINNNCMPEEGSTYNFLPVLKNQTKNNPIYNLNLVYCRLANQYCDGIDWGDVSVSPQPFYRFLVLLWNLVTIRKICNNSFILSVLFSWYLISGPFSSRRRVKTPVSSCGLKAWQSASCGAVAGKSRTWNHSPLGKTSARSLTAHAATKPKRGSSYVSYTEGGTVQFWSVQLRIWILR